MNDLMSNKKTATLVIAAFVALILGAIYYLFIYPLNEEKNTKESTVTTVQSEIAVLEEQLVAPVVVEEETEEQGFDLKKKVPPTRGLDELIRSIEEVEQVTESIVESIDFNNYDGLVAESVLAPTETEDGVETTEDTTTTEATTDTETPVSPVAGIVLPPQLKLLTFNISVLTKDYDHFKLFIEELEALERIVRVDQLSFAVPGEEQFYAMDSDETVAAEIQVTTFYYDEEL
ncbi:hypothetical protein C7437_101189 [Psychrobacillus insolitus]|uniref:Type IV pilus assembly protein PilO n=1 Tax=Psychrobacillus insolitus TaxID=1461 RepID=A0A2W7MID8_9BACI|nr:potassium transporter [Psychrobacillus insolitus]PZX07082.1 hypothetical protein C7437_101189 [Psychrobacillus insolitus]